MNTLYIALMTVWATGTDELSERVVTLRQDDSERGSVTVEQAIITGAVTLAAILVVGLIVAAVNKYSANIG